MASLIHHVAHGFVGGEAVYFGNLVPDDCGLIEGDTYYVLAAGITADDFSVSETDGGTPFDLTFDIEEGIVSIIATYEPITDPLDVLPPPVVPSAPSAPAPTSALVSGVVRLTIGVADITSESIRNVEVQSTHSFSGSDADWTRANVFTLPHGQTQVTVPCLGSTVYAVRRRVHDVFGNTSDWSTEATITTEAGDEVLQAAISSLANDIPDFLITDVKIADGAIQARHVSANSISANALAATIILTSLLATGEAGERRVEVDDQGIRLIAADESPVVTIPTDATVPVYVSGRVDASSLVTNDSAEFRLIASLASSAVMTLQNGVATPTTAPGVVASVDSLALTSTPSAVSTAAGIGYDAGAGTFWIAQDPSVSPYYVATEYNATTGAVVRHITATGGTSTTTATLGSTSHISDGANGRDGSTDSHVTTPLTMPSPAGATNMKVTKVAAYFAGHNGSCTARVGIWNTSNSNLGTSAEFTASSGGATGTGNSDLHNVSLSSPESVTPGSTYRFGWYHTDSGEGHQWDFDSGSSKTTYSGDGTTASGTGWGTLSSSAKPNVWITYTYDVDTRLETLPNIAVCTDGTYVYTLDTSGVVWKYNRTTLAYVAKSAVQTAITGTKSKAGMFIDLIAGTPELLITTTTGTGAGVYPKLVRVNLTTLAVSSTVYTAATGPTFSGTTDTFRGGARVSDTALGGSALTYWIATTSAVYAYTFATTVLTNVSNRDFGQSTTMGDGLTYDGTYFRGWDSATPTKVWKFSAWDWTSASAIYWTCYAWYDSAGTTHETVVGPRTSLTLRRHERVQITTPAIPTGGVDDPNSVRVYMKPNATDPGAGGFKHQVTDALTSRYLTDYNGGGASDGAGTLFPAGTPAQLTGAASGSWSLRGDGSLALPTASAPVTSDGRAYWDTTKTVRIYDGTRIKPVTPIGYLPWAWPLGFNNEATFSATRSLAAVVAGSGQAVAMPFMLHAPMLLDSYTVWNVDTASLRTCEMRLYYDDGTANAVFVTGSDATLSFTPTVASSRTASVSGAPVILAPGVYWHVIRNTSTSQLFSLATSANTSPGAIAATVRVGTIAALGATLDIITNLSGASNGAHAMKLQGRVFGRSVADF